MPTSSDCVTCSALTLRFREFLDSLSDSEGAGQIQLHGTGAVQTLERKLRAYFDVRHALCVSNCTTGLLAVAMGLQLLDSEILVPPLLYGASISGLLLLRNRLRFCDVDPKTLTIDPACARRSITRRTRAILGVDLFGVPCDSPSLRQIAQEHGLFYILDAAQSLGATRNGVPTGQEADASVVSFTAGKTLFAGEGGAVLTNSDQLYNRLLWWTQHPNRQRRELSLDNYNEVNLNGRIHPLAAVWADSMFQHALDRLNAWQKQCFRIIELLHSLGVIESNTYEERRIRPAFFRLVLALRDHREPSEVERVLSRAGIRISVSAAPINPIYRSATFMSQYGHRVSGIRHCQLAGQQARKLVSLAIPASK